jgi:hypothetical protein
MAGHRLRAVLMWSAKVDKRKRKRVTQPYTAQCAVHVWVWICRTNPYPSITSQMIQPPRKFTTQYARLLLTFSLTPAQLSVRNCSTWPDVKLSLDTPPQFRGCCRTAPRPVSPGALSDNTRNWWAERHALNHGHFVSTGKRITSLRS